MNYLIYGDLINSRAASSKAIKYFWAIFPKLNKKCDFLVPFFPFLGDSFIGAAPSKEAALLWVKEIQTKLKTKNLQARYVLVPLRGDFSKLNSESKLFKEFSKTNINPLNVPELLLVHQYLESIKHLKTENIKVFKLPSLKSRSKFHTIMTKEYFKDE